VFNPELEKYASDCFNQVAQARLNLATIGKTEDVLIYKKYHGVSFITNGYDFWFKKNISLKAAAVMTLLDYFGCKLQDDNCSYYNKPNELDYDDDEPIHELEGITDVKEIFKFLQGRDKEKDSEEEECKLPDQVNDFSEEDADEHFESLRSNLKEYYSEKEVKKEWCENCGFVPTQSDICHFLRTRNSEIKEQLSDLQEEFSIFIFNKEVKIKMSNIEITDDTIIFDEMIPSVSFAACMEHKKNIHYMEKLIAQENICISGYKRIPPIPYVESDEGYHLKIELFNNGFVRNKEFEFSRHG